MKLVVRVMGVMVGAALLSAQTARPVFEVASIKQNLSRAAGTPFRDYVRPGGRFTVTNISVAELIQFAYRVQDGQIIDGPAWVRSDRFDVVAKADHEASIQEVRSMVQSLLADRFHLALKTEQSEMAINEVVLNRADGRLGPYLVQLSPEDTCETIAPKITAAQGYQKPPSGALRGQSCGPVPGVFTGPAHSFVKTPVVDRTGLTGSWAFLIFFGPDATMARGDVVDNPNLPSYFTAWQEQLGLRLRPTRGLVDVLTIVSVQRPEEN